MNLGVTGPRILMDPTAKPGDQLLDVPTAEGKLGLQDRLPSLEPVVVDLPQCLDVEQRVADLDRVARRRDQVDLVGFLDAGRAERFERILGGSEAS